MNNFKTLVDSKIIATPAEIIDYNDGRISLNNSEWSKVRERLDIIRTNFIEDNGYERGLYPALAKNFSLISAIPTSTTLVNNLYKTTRVPRYWNRDAIGFVFALWILNLSDDYRLKYEPHSVLPILATSNIEVVKPSLEAFERFVAAHQGEIQGALVKAWREITTFYNIEVVLASLRNMGFSDDAIAILSRAAG